MKRMAAVVRMVLIVAALAVGGYVAMSRVFGLRVEFDGTGMRPIFSFDDRDRHFRALDEERAALPLAPEPEAASAASAVAASTAAAPVTAAPAPPAAPWPDFRGPARDGVIRGIAIRRDWPLRELWRTKVGGGYASMIVAEGKLFTIEQRRAKEVVAAYDAATGRQFWEDGWDAFFQEALGGDGPRATPTYADGRVYALGAEGELRCLAASNGELLWRTNILQDAKAKNVTWGMSGAPLVHDGKVIVHPGGSGGKSIAAYDAKTGELVWQSLDDKAGYASPQLLSLAGRPQALVFTGKRMVSVDPADGKLLWAVDWQTSYDVNSAQPIQVDANRVWFSSGYGKGSALYEIVAEGDALRPRKLWETNTMKAKFNPAVLHDGHIYGLDDGILACVRLSDGERAWKGGRYGFGQLLLADGHLVVLTERGEIALVEATPEAHRELAKFQAIEGKTWNVPAYADGRLFVRNQTEMAAYRLAE